MELDMIDICFSDSVGGSLLVIKDLIKSDGVFPLDLHLNYGSLNGDIIEEQAKRNVDTLNYFYKTITEKEWKKEYQAERKKDNKAQKTLQKFLADGQKFRLWLSNSANDRCGLYWFCDLVKDYNNEVSVVFCQGYEYDDVTNKTIENRNWACYGTNPYCMAEAVSGARILTKDEILASVETWSYIVKENAPLRILIDDNIVGVEESFFDNVILGFVTREPQAQASIMGKMLGKWHGCCDVAFVSKRIEHLIEAGLIEVVEEKIDDYDCYWARTLVLV